MSESKKIVMGHVYSAKVGGAYVSVRAEKSLGHGRYEGTTVRLDGTGSKVKFSTDGIRGDGMTEAAWREKNKPKAATEAEAKAIDAAIKAPKTKDAKKSKPAGAKKPSGLDAAVVVLAEAGKPMSTTDMVKRMLETKLWKTNGKTPAATIYAAIIREIAVKGKDSRFRKTDRGMFELTSAGIEARTAAGKAQKG